MQKRKVINNLKFYDHSLKSKKKKNQNLLIFDRETNIVIIFSPFDLK